ncbi:MAG: triphosphoribosyl-dephospho-CoA synthase [Candidatus Bathyarchaeota archaeon]|nr:triphosphoribosyl-dephospho-CoA synthase [Candidatus Bathyarchaeota archaeon]
MPHCEKAKHIAKCLELAILLEVSADKPGNVNFVVGFEGTRVEHFLASAVATREAFEEAANRGIAISCNRLKVENAGVGELIRACAADVAAWQKGGNTLIGTIMLFAPLAVAAGMTPMRNGGFDFIKLRRNLKLTVESTTPQDAVYLYEAIEIAKPSGLNGAPDFDVRDPKSKDRLLKEQVSLFKVFQIAAGYDDICYEWVNNFAITFDLSYPYLKQQLERTNLNTAIIHTFLKVLSERPDTFIARKVGVEKAREISRDAQKVLELGGVETESGRRSISAFDRKLRSSDSLYNPGTTADLTAAALALCTLSGYRP